MDEKKAREVEREARGEVQAVHVQQFFRGLNFLPRPVGSHWGISSRGDFCVSVNK